MINFTEDRSNTLVEYEVVGGTDTYKRRYTHGPGMDNPVKLHLELGATDKDFTYHADALGSIRLLSEDDKETAMSYTYTPYGETTTTIINENAKVNRFTYTARELETASMLFFRSRFYNNQQGRFFKKDIYPPDYEKPLSYNRYLYVEGNPINLIDPIGYSAVPIGPVVWDPPTPSLIEFKSSATYDDEGYEQKIGKTHNWPLYGGPYQSADLQIDVWYGEIPGSSTVDSNYSWAYLDIYYDFNTTFELGQGRSKLSIVRYCDGYGPYTLFETTGTQHSGYKHYYLKTTSGWNLPSYSCSHQIRLLARPWRNIQVKLRLWGLSYRN